MKIQIDEEYKKLCHILEIKPGKLKVSIIIACLFLSVITAGIPLLIYWKWQKFKNFIHHIVFEQVQKDSQEIDHYLIVDSKRFQSEFRSIQFRNHIVKPYLVQQQKAINKFDSRSSIKAENELCKYIEHKNLRYLIKNNVLRSLEFKVHKSISTYIEEGLTDPEITLSQNVYGKSNSFLVNFWDVLTKNLHQKKVRYFFMFFAIKKIVVGIGMISDDKEHHNSNQVKVIILIIIEIVITLILSIGISIFGANWHNEIHQKIQDQTKYVVIRNGQKIEVKLNELYVGDIVIPKIGQIIYFKGLLVAEQFENNEIGYATINQKLYNRKDEPIQKNVLISHLSQVFQLNVINPGSQILNMSTKQGSQHFNIEVKPNDQKAIGSKEKKTLKQAKTTVKFYEKSQHLNKKDDRLAVPKQMSLVQQISQSQLAKKMQLLIIVTDNNYIQKFYKAFKQEIYFNNYSSMRKSYDRQQVIFEAFFFFISILATLWVMENKRNSSHWINILFSHLLLCFPFNLAMFCSLSQVLSIIRLKRKGVSTINPFTEEIGMIDNLTLELSTFQKLQFSGFVKKQRCTRMPLPERFQDSESLFQIFRKAREQSIFAFFIWAGIMNLPVLQKQAVQKQIFQKYEFAYKQKSQFDQEEDNKKTVINKDESTIKISWKQFQRFPLSQKLIETVIVEDTYANKFQNKLIILSQGYFTSQKCEDYFDQLIMEEGKSQFKESVRRLFMQGKKLKYISLKRNFIKDQKTLQIQRFRRKDIEKNLQFGGFLIFDEWPTQQNMQVLIQMDFISDHLKLTIFSIRSESSLIGYDHNLRKSQILFAQESKQRSSQLFQRKNKYEAILHIGHGILDQGCHLLADISINKISPSYGAADFQITEPVQCSDVLHEGIWSLYNTSLTIICLILFNFSKIIGQLFIYQNNPQNKLQSAPLAQSFDTIFIIDVGALILPIILLNLYEPAKKLVKQSQRHFFRIQLAFYVIVSLLGLIILYTIEFLDHKFEDVCQTQYKNAGQTHLLAFRLHKQTQNTLNDSNYQNPCLGIIFFINISFCFLVILIFDRQTKQRKARNLLLGMINKIYMLIVWIWSIVHFQIPIKNVLRSGIVVFLMAILVWASDIIKFLEERQQQHKQDEKNIENIPQQFIIN